VREEDIEYRRDLHDRFWRAMCGKYSPTGGGVGELRIPGEGERDSGVKLNRVPG